MNMKNLLEDLFEKMRMIHLFRRTAERLTEKEIEDLATIDESFEGRPNRQADSSSYHNFGIRSLGTGNAFFYGLTRLSIDQRRQFTMLAKNKQYQWLLAEAFEVFQDFMWKSYALVGSIDRNFWPLEDYGNISLSELSGKDFSWFYEQAKKKKKNIRGIIKLYRKKRPALAKLEQQNALNYDLRVFLPLIEQLRHVIVHCGGAIVNKDEFIKEVLDTEGLYKNGRIDSQTRLILDIPFGQKEYANTVALLEQQDKDVPIFEHQRFELFTECLMSYAHAVAKNLILQDSDFED